MTTPGFSDTGVRGGHELPPPHYTFTDRSGRLNAETHSAAEYTDDPTLGRDIEVDILVKWTNQTYHDDNLRAMFTPNWDPVAGISRTNAWRHRNRYYDGLIVQATLDADYTDAQTVNRVTPALQPTGVDNRRDGLTAFACANSIFLSPDGDPSHITQTISHPTFARLHSVEFSPDGQRLLTASSSLDLVHEVDTDGNVLWSFDAWEDTPFNTNKLGQTFFRSFANAPNTPALHNPDPVALKDEESLRGATCVLDDPDSYNSLGLPTNLTPVFINTASYGPDDKILVTSFHRGEAWAIDRRARQIDVVAKDMVSPHAFHQLPNNQGYMVTDTGNERLKLISNDLASEISIDFSGLTERKPGLEQSRWLQYTTYLGSNLYCAVIAPRQRLTLFDPVRRLKRDISFDPDWGIQLVTKHNPRTASSVLGAIVSKAAVAE